LKNTFANSSDPDPVETTLHKLGCAFERQPDGTLLVEGSIDLAGNGLTQLPELSSVILTGNFLCYNNQLTSLKGAPQSVGGNFYCDNNQLTSLKSGPQAVGGSFGCSNNHLTNLEGAPQFVVGNFDCNHNYLTSLEGAPQSIGEGFFCSHNDLVSLKGGPQFVGKGFCCDNNHLTSLEHTPQTFRMLRSDLGDFMLTNIEQEKERERRADGSRRLDALEQLRKRATEKHPRLKKPPAP